MVKVSTNGKRPKLQAPFPWFGGKSRVADLVWERFDVVDNYVEPFFGSGAVLLGSPRIHRTETINDADGFVCNFWRAVAHDPEAVAEHADWPVNENDLHARHAYLTPLRGDITSRLEGDPNFYDVKIAGWWVWGICSWIAGGWCEGNGPWRSVDGRLVKTKDRGVNRKLPHLGNAGQGVNRKRSDMSEKGIRRQRPHLGHPRGSEKDTGIIEWFEILADRLRRVRVCCGDWSRVLGKSPTITMGLTGVFLDPPYSHGTGRSKSLYSMEMPSTEAIQEWCEFWGENPDMRIALCGYEGEYDLPGWDVVAWKAHGGYSAGKGANGHDNKHRERIWFSPWCLSPEDLE